MNEGYEVPVYYDSMIAKLAAWADSRPDAIARMARALGEYQVLGIKTTIPFFLWLMRQEDYRTGRYDTTYLDRLLAERRASGASFSEVSESESELAAIAVGVDAFLRASGGTISPERRKATLWTQAARREGLRA